MIETAQEYETAVLRAVGVEPEAVPWRRWARTYEQLSSALTEDREDVLRTQVSGALGDRDTRAVAALVFGARSFVAARAIASAYPPPAGTVAELGAGCGPFGLAAASLGQDVELHDVAPESLELAPALFRAAGASPPRCLVGRADELAGEGYAAIALAFSLNEMLAQAVGSPELADRWIGGWLSRLGPGGRLYLLEPGTKRQSRQLQALRDHWRRHVVAPCPQVEHACPLLAESRDWCHFTWPHAPGPVTRRLAQMAGRESGQMHFSWLVLAPSPDSVAAGTSARLLELRYPDRHKVTGVVCCPQGNVNRVTALRRDQAPYELLTSLRPGAVLELRDETMEQKGDGLRVRSIDSLRVLRPI